MQLTEEGLALIRQFEGFRASAYRCPAGVWTIGYGHTGAAGPPDVSPGMRISREEAERVLAADAGRVADEIRRHLTTKLSDRQFSALVSFAYNVGIAAFTSSSVLRAANGRDLAAVPRRLQLWVNGGGRVLPGLVRRRAAEAALFLDAQDAPPPAQAGPPKASPGKSAWRSTTILSGLVAALSAVLPVAGGRVSIPEMLLAAAAVSAAAWIISERLKKAREDGI